MGLNIIGLGFIFIVILFVLSAYNNDQKDAEKRRIERERIRYLRDKIPIYKNILRGFVIRFPRKSPYNIVIHRNNCIQSKPAGESNMSSSWLGYFKFYEDAERYSELTRTLRYSRGVSMRARRRTKDKG